MKGRIIHNGSTNRISFPIIGKIKVGIKNEKGLPKSIDYFVSTGKYAGLFNQAYGDKPQTIQIVFLSDDPETVCNEMYEYRDDEGKRIAYGDGETFMVWDGKKYIVLTVTEYPHLMENISKRYPNRKTRKGDDGWDITLTLNFIIPMVRGVAGLWQFVTKGTASTIPNIRDTFDAMLEEKGYVRGIIFDLNVQFATSQKPGDKSRYPVVSIVPNESEENVKKIKESFSPVKLVE